MKTEQIFFDGNKLELQVKKPSHFVVILLTSAASFCIIVPLVYFLVLLSESATGNGIQYMTIIFLLIPLLFGIYLSRLFLWNFFGREVYEFGKDKISFYRDFRYFKDSKKTFKYKDLKIKLEKSGYENEKKAILSFDTKEGRHKSMVELPENELEKLTELLNQKIKENL